MAVSMMIMNAKYTPVETSGKVELNSMPREMADPTKVPSWKMAQNTVNERPLSFSIGYDIMMAPCAAQSSAAAVVIVSEYTQNQHQKHTVTRRGKTH
jgi:hypothetical protein